jgi:uncharacterized protein (TIGR02996 family)
MAVPDAHFLRAVFADPGDKNPRLVYADYLDENGRSKPARSLRADGRWRWFRHQNYFYLAWEPKKPEGQAQWWESSLPGLMISGISAPLEEVEPCLCGGRRDVVYDGGWQCRDCRRNRADPTARFLADDEPADWDGQECTAVSLWQPWATLVVTGAKRLETRGYNTRVRGRILIHAAKRWTTDQKQIASRRAFLAALTHADNRLGGVTFGRNRCGDRTVEDLPRGCLLGSVELVNSAVIGDEPRQVLSAGWIPPNPPEWDFGDYTPGRYVWVLRDPRPFKRPVPYKGERGFFKASLARAES